MNNLCLESLPSYMHSMWPSHLILLFLIINFNFSKFVCLFRLPHFGHGPSVLYPILVVETCDVQLPIFTRHSLVRAKGEVFVLLLLFCSFFCQRFLDNLRANLRQILHAGVLWFRMCPLSFWELAVPGGRKKGEMKFLLLWESMGNFCILAVFEWYLSNACTDPQQILFV